MSKDGLDKFAALLEQDEELTSRIPDMLVDELVSIGKEHGCEFSGEELVAEMDAVDDELSDDDLDDVAGGGGRRFGSVRLRRLWRGFRVACPNGKYRPGAAACPVGRFNKR